MLYDLRGHAAVVTGAGGGIGLAIALRLADLGMNLVLCGRNEEKLNKAGEEVRAKGVQAEVCLGDLTDSRVREKAVQTAQEAFGRLDVLVNNAGVAQSQPFEEITEEDFDRILNINLKAPYFLTQRALPMLRKSPAASIINIGSVVSNKGYPLQSAYGASKHGILGFSKSIANELYKENIRVHVICPGGVYTDMVRVARPDLSADGLILPEDIADMVEFLLSHRTFAVIDQINVHRAGKEPFA